MPKVREGYVNIAFQVEKGLHDDYIRYAKENERSLAKQMIHDMRRVVKGMANIRLNKD